MEVLFKMHGMKLRLFYKIIIKKMKLSRKELTKYSDIFLKAKLDF